MMVFKKSQIVTVSLVFMLIIAGYLNFLYTDKQPNDDPVASIDFEENDTENYGEAKFVSAPNDAKLNYFNETKLNKEKSRSEALSLLKQVSEDANANPEAKQEAQNNIIKMAKFVETEGKIENILMGKGFEKISVYITDENVTVAVLTGGLETADIAKIRDVVITETKVSADKIKIMEIK